MGLRSQNYVLLHLTVQLAFVPFSFLPLFSPMSAGMRTLLERLCCVKMQVLWGNLCCANVSLVQRFGWERGHCFALEVT